jgi:serine/threonine protein kinase
MIIEACEWLGQAVGEGRFLIIRCLRDGGMSQIFLGEDTTTGESVIVKVPKLEQVEYDAAFRQRFQRETHALKQLAHPNIVRILCGGEMNGTPFVVLRYLEGGTLGDRMYTGPEQTAEPQPAEALLSWLPTIAEALDFIHNRGYVHRDIKPHNILFDGEGKPFLGDLGIARVLAATPGTGGALTRLGERPPGTPPYMAPEQICGQTGSPLSDQFALAVIVFEWLTGRRPFAGLTPEDVFDSQREPLTLMHHVQPGLPEGMSQVVARALSRRPTDRFPTCQEFVSQLIATHLTPPRVPAAKVTRLATDFNPASLPTEDNDWSIPVQGEEPSLPSVSSRTPAPLTVPDLPPPPEPMPVPVRRRSEKPAPEATSSGRPWAGRVLCSMLVLVLLVAACFGGSFFLPGTSAQQWVGERIAPLLKQLGAPGWQRDQAVIQAPMCNDAQAEARISTLQTENERLARQLNEASNRLDKAVEALDRTRQETDRQREAAKRDLARESERARKAEEKVEGLKREREKLSKENEKLGHEKAEANKAKEKLGEEKEKLGADKEKLSKALDESNKKLDAESSRFRAAEKDRDEAMRAQAEAQKQAVAVGVENKALKEKLALVEQTMKETKLWFVLKNLTDSPVRYKIRTKLWNGDWSEWTPGEIGKKGIKRISAPPGSIRIEVHYDAALLPGKKAPRFKGVNARSFRGVAEPSVNDIDSTYAFVYSRERKELQLVWR